MLRSPLDLLLTALVLAATAVLLFVDAARRVARAERAGSPAAGERAPVRDVLAPILGAAVVVLAVRLAFVFVGRVVADSNPHLIGSQLDFLAPRSPACTRLAGRYRSWLVLAMLATDALRGRRALPVVWAAAAVAVVALLVRQTSWLTALTGVMLFVGGLRLRSLLRDDRFTSSGWLASSGSRSPRRSTAIPFTASTTAATKRASRKRPRVFSAPATTCAASCSTMC
jgi:hypothetical protein